MFLSVENALNWAYATSDRSIIKMAAINNMRGTVVVGYSNGLLDNLNAQDRHGQAALIIGLIDQLQDPAEREFLKARFGRRVSRDELKYLIYRGCEGIGVGLERREGVYRVLRGYFGGQVSLRYFRKVFGCRHGYAILARKGMFDALDVINLRALDDMRRILQERGLIEE